MRTTTALAVGTACVAVLGAAVPASAAGTKPLLTGHLSISAVEGSLPAGATVSVLQFCSAGSTLDASGTRQIAKELGSDLDRHVRLASREFWPAGTVSRYRVTRRVTAGQPVMLLDVALCTSTVAGTATTVSGRAATDLRIWGPAPARLQLTNATVALTTDDINAEHVFATAMKAGGVASSKGSLPDAVEAVQETTEEEGLGAVAAVGKTKRSVARGRFISMKNSYSYVSDLTKKITETDSPDH